MKTLKAILAGFAGAAALNILHETVRRLDPEAPEVHLIGEEALSKSMKHLNMNPPTGDNLYWATLAGDLISNGMYYSTIGLSGKGNLYIKGAVAGLSAGLGAIQLPEQIGLHDEPVTKTTKTKILTVAWYLAGGLVTAAVMKSLNKR